MKPAKPLRTEVRRRALATAAERLGDAQGGLVDARGGAEERGAAPRVVRGPNGVSPFDFD